MRAGLCVHAAPPPRTPSVTPADAIVAPDSRTFLCTIIKSAWVGFEDDIRKRTELKETASGKRLQEVRAMLVACWGGY